MTTNNPTRVWFGEGAISPTVTAHLAKHAVLAKPQAEVGKARTTNKSATEKDVVRVVVGEGAINPSVQRHLHRS